MHGGLKAPCTIMVDMEEEKELEDTPEQQAAIVAIPWSSFYCYIIAHSNGKSTYNGYTNNLVRRLRQHNGEIKGGAKATTRIVGGGWGYIATLTSPEWTAQRAMQHEWTVKYPTRHRPRPAKFQGPRGRIESLAIVLPQIPEQVTLQIHPDYIHLLQQSDIPVNVQLSPLAHD